MGNLKSRLDRIARGIRQAAGQFVVVWPAHRDAPPIERRGASHVALNVPEPAAGDFDPRGHLTEEQRAMIGINDHVIVLQYVDEGPADA